MLQNYHILSFVQNRSPEKDLGHSTLREQPLRYQLNMTNNQLHNSAELIRKKSFSSF